ncbi:MAG: CHAD domain-containing protein [Mycobacteriales bacterium]
MASEIERKYEVPVGFTVPAEIAPGVTLGDPVVHELHAVYYDTADLRLARNRVAVRRRTGGADAGWHVKRYRAPDERDEVQLPLGRSGTVPAAVSAEVRAVSRGAGLRPVVTVDTTRTERPLLDPDGRVLALVADDVVRTGVTADPSADQQWRELEVELVDGDRALLEDVDRRLREAGAAPSADAAKIARALDGRWPAEDRPAGPEGSAAAVVGDYVRAQREAMVEWDPRVRRDEPDSVHKMRVATRRLRSTLKTFGRLYDRATVDRLRTELRWLADVLGAVRDSQVMAARLDGALAAEPPELVLGPVAARLGDGLRARTAKLRRSLVVALDGRRYTTLLDDLDELLATPPTERGCRPAGRELRRRVRRTVRKVHRLLDAAGRAADRAAQSHRSSTAPPLPGVLGRDEALHEARKAAKEARYAAEAAEPAAGEPAKRLTKAMEDLQELLGDHHDSVVTRQLLREAGLAAHAAGENAFTYGLLHGRQAAAAGQIEADLPAARKAIAAKPVRRWLGQL